MLEIKSEIFGGDTIWGRYKNGERIDFYDRLEGCNRGLTKEEIREIINEKYENNL